MGQGNSQRAALGAVDKGGAQRFAIYAGDGFYLRSLSRDAAGVQQFGRDRARCYTRQGAVNALHTVRRSGVLAWIVPHPMHGGAA